MHLAGLWHVRRGPALIVVLLVGAGLTALFPDMILDASVRHDLAPRGVGTAELVGVALASVIPALSLPAFDGRELLGGSQSRVAHTVWSALMPTLPAIILPVWAVRIRQVHPDADVPSVIGLIGTPVLCACLAMVTCLLAGRLWSVPVPWVAYGLLIAGQQLHPDSVLTTWFAAPRNWHTPWLIVTLAILLTAGLAYVTQSVPWRARRTS